MTDILKEREERRDLILDVALEVLSLIAGKDLLGPEEYARIKLSSTLGDPAELIIPIKVEDQIIWEEILEHD